MNARRHLEYRLAACVRIARACITALLLVPGLSGCRHKTMPVKFPQISHAPVELDVPEEPSEPIMIATLPQDELAPIAVPLPPPQKRKPAPTPKEETQPPAQVAESAPAEFAIGSLSTGDDVAPQAQQQAQDMIASILKRIAALPAKTADSKKRQVRQVRNFLNQAQQALNSGDAQGAKNLATKASLLMDDLEKK